ncbi:MAG: signal peptidase I [Oscillospiraceae bacterium]|jgi:signal peptidase|nr:signal peptidase I [Oscillospiraceae bacterium]
MRKAISTVCNVLGTLILVVIIFAAGGILLLQVMGNKPMGILSGSMEPAYHVGGLVFINSRVEPEQVAPGDVIAYYISEETVVTHRVVEVHAAEREFTTKGDNNESGDLAPVPFDAMIGRAWLHIPRAGTLLMNMKTPKGVGVGIITIAILIVLFVVPVILAPPKREITETADTSTGKGDGKDEKE